MIRWKMDMLEGGVRVADGIDLGVFILLSALS